MSQPPARVPLLALLALLGCSLGCSLGWSLGCSHDLDALRAERDATGLRAGGGGAGGGGRGGPSGSGGSSGSSAGGAGGAGAGGGDAGQSPDGGASGGGGAGSAGPCEPCPELSAQATNLGLRTCCRGPTDLECGLTFGEGTLCLPRDVPGQPNDACPEANPEGKLAPLMLPGCCRPDGRCGVVVEQVGLGCVARDDIFPALGLPAAVPIACRFTCEADADCGGGGANNLVCAETDDRSARFCAERCTRDRDCARGTICALSNDVDMDRVLAICRDPVGEAEPGETCASANDCVNGVCSRLMAGGAPFCTELCDTPADCGPTADRCAASAIPSPSGENTNTFRVCLP